MQSLELLNEEPVSFIQAMSLANRENYIVEDGKIVRVESKNETN